VIHLALAVSLVIKMRIFTMPSREETLKYY